MIFNQIQTLSFRVRVDQRVMNSDCKPSKDLEHHYFIYKEIFNASSSKKVKRNISTHENRFLLHYYYVTIKKKISQRNLRNLKLFSKLQPTLNFFEVINLFLDLLNENMITFHDFMYVVSV